MIGKWNLTNLQEDVKLLKDMNMDTFRFSIAWTRILPSEYILNWCANDRWASSSQAPSGSLNFFAFAFACIAAAAGSLSGGINKEGVAFYNSLINEVIANGSPSINQLSLPSMQLIL